MPLRGASPADPVSPCVFIFAPAEFKLHFGWRAFSCASAGEWSPLLFFFATGSGPLVADETERHEPDVDMFASMAGKCSALKIAERDFACATVAFFHSPGGRSSFTVPLDDPYDDSHIVTFSGEKARESKIICTSYRLTGCC